VLSDGSRPDEGHESFGGVAFGCEKADNTTLETIKVVKKNFLMLVVLVEKMV